MAFATDLLPNSFFYRFLSSFDCGVNLFRGVGLHAGTTRL
jgi:hypothetical protein